MKTTHIMTLDGDTVVEWWEKEDFKNRVTSITSGGHTTTIPIPDDVVLCDFCNVEIKEFPVPVVRGTHAVCNECLESIQVKEEHNAQD